MKKFILFILGLAIAAYLFNGFKVNASEISYVNVSDKLTVEGAQIRTAGNVGLRFVGKCEIESESIIEYGFLIAFGEVDYNEIVEGIKINKKSVLKISMAALDTENYFYGTITNIPENMYSQDITARPYIKLKDETIIYGIGATRNTAEVAYKVSLDENFEDNEFINSIIAKSEQVFTINGKAYAFLMGMTWGDWLESKYNTSYKDAKFDSLDDYADWYWKTYAFEAANKWLSPFKKYIDETTIEQNGIKYKNVAYVLYDGSLFIAGEDQRLQYGGLAFYNKSGELLVWERYTPFGLFHNDWYIRENGNTQYKDTLIKATNYNVVYDD